MSTDGDDENKTVPEESEDALKTVSKEDLELF